MPAAPLALAGADKHVHFAEGGSPGTHVTGLQRALDRRGVADGDLFERLVHDGLHGWGSILGVLPFTLSLPYVGLTATLVLSVLIGLVLSSAFSAIVVYGQELMPGQVGMVSGLFFGLAFGMGGIGAAVLGELADWTSIEFVYHVCSFLPMIGLLAVFLPNVERPSHVTRISHS